MGQSVTKRGFEWENMSNYRQQKEFVTGEFGLKSVI